jgi:ATP-dependent DNA ligase
MALPVNPATSPMLAKAVDKLPDVPMLYEPKWDGFRCIVFQDGDEVTLASRNERPFNRYFPELLEPLRRNLPDRCVIDGEIVVPTPRGLDFSALQMRLHPAESRVKMLSEQSPASFITFDLLAIGDTDCREVPLINRRAALEDGLRWFDEFEGAGLDVVIAKPLDGHYLSDQ